MPADTPSASQPTRPEERHYPGEFIPLHYHHNMLLDSERMAAFRAAIALVVRPGTRVADLGGGTGVLSWFAAQQAGRVWCVELNAELVAEARNFLAGNDGGERVEVVHADALHWLPPEPLDVVICEMLHSALLRERQVEMLDSFRKRYLDRFGPPLPTLVPEAALLAVQALEQDFCFHGYQAPIIQFQTAECRQPSTRELGAPVLYRTMDFTEANDATVAWAGELPIASDGTVNALRFITRNVLAVDLKRGSSIDWLNNHMLLPLPEPIRVSAGDTLELSFRYPVGGPIGALRDSLRTDLRTGLRTS